MRLGKAAAVLAWAAAFAFAASSTWTVRTHLLVRERVHRETSTARTILQDTSDLDPEVAVSGSLDKLTRDQTARTAHNVSTQARRDKANAHFYQDFVTSLGATRAHHVQSQPKVWLYALFNTNYDGPKLAPHFAR